MPRLRHNEKALPRSFAGHPHGVDIVYEEDLRVGTSRLRAKLLVFGTKKGLASFWKNALGFSRIGRNCPGVVNSLIYQKTVYDGDVVESAVLLADRRYFCVIGIVKWAMRSSEVVAHESVHAGFCYAKRIKRTPWDARAKEMDEEAIAYPAGEIARELSRVFWKLHGKV